MTDTVDAIVLQDSEGAYYVIPKQVLEEARVPAGSKAKIDEDLGETQGFSMNFSYLGPISLSPQRVADVFSSDPFFNPPPKIREKD